MGRNKKVVVTDELVIDSVVNEDLELIASLEEVEQEVVPTIYDKYAKYVEQANAGYLVGLSYNNKVEILRYCEEKIGAKMPMNLNCGVCVIDLIKLFVRLKDK